MSRARRRDPDRKQRILQAAVEVIAEHGLPRTTHRLIAATADVPLGSLTYHFSTLDDLCRQGFEQYAARLSTTYAAYFEAISTREQLIDAVTDLICGDAGASTADWAVAYELYLAALRDPTLRSVTQEWMRTSRATLERFVDPTTARGIDALVEGLVLHNILSVDPLPRDAIHSIIAQQVAAAPQ